MDDEGDTEVKVRACLWVELQNLFHFLHSSLTETQSYKRYTQKEKNKLASIPSYMALFAFN